MEKRSRPFRRCLAVALPVLLLGACHSVPPAALRTEAAERLAQQAGLQALALASAPLPLRGFARLGCPGADIAVYIEGDGYAWVTAGQPSTDPTPVAPVALRLAVLDPACNLVYLGRPGQYGSAAVGVRYWTDARFAPEVVDSYVTALRQLRAGNGGGRLHLTGFSGGGAVAALAAARLAGDAEGGVTLRTVAGNLDVAAWVQQRRLTPLRASLNPADEAQALAMIPQLHLAGQRDRQVATTVLESYLAKLPARDCVAVRFVDAAHGGPWEEAWRAVLPSLPACVPLPDVTGPVVAPAGSVPPSR
jgi:pimeloyl-ACP methyl ester carboxylesterase